MGLARGRSGRSPRCADGGGRASRTRNELKNERWWGRPRLEPALRFLRACNSIQSLRLVDALVLRVRLAGPQEPWAPFGVPFVIRCTLCALAARLRRIRREQCVACGPIHMARAISVFLGLPQAEVLRTHVCLLFAALRARTHAQRDGLARCRRLRQVRNRPSPAPTVLGGGYSECL